MVFLYYSLALVHLKFPQSAQDCVNQDPGMLLLLVMSLEFLISCGSPHLTFVPVTSIPWRDRVAFRT